MLGVPVIGEVRHHPADLEAARRNDLDEPAAQIHTAPTRWICAEGVERGGYSLIVTIWPPTLPTALPTTFEIGPPPVGPPKSSAT